MGDRGYINEAEPRGSAFPGGSLGTRPEGAGTFGWAINESRRLRLGGKRRRGLRWEESSPYHSPMLSLHSTSPDRWLQQVREHLDDVLVDHAHCEKKAAGTAMNLIFYYVENEELCREMTVIVNEELDHFQQVLGLLHRRSIRFRRIKPGRYGSQLHALVRKQEPQRALDRLLVAGLIEARSCERFGLLREHLSDSELVSFYDSLFESEARHHSTYIRLARHYADDATLKSRLDELAAAEAEIISAGDPLPRMHS